jgi:hypothetical protein
MMPESSSENSGNISETSAAPPIPDDVLRIVAALRANGAKLINREGNDLQLSDLERLVKECSL